MVVLLCDFSRVHSIIDSESSSWVVYQSKKAEICLNRYEECISVRTLPVRSGLRIFVHKKDSCPLKINIFILVMCGVIFFVLCIVMAIQVSCGKQLLFLLFISRRQKALTEAVASYNTQLGATVDEIKPYP